MRRWTSRLKRVIAAVRQCVAGSRVFFSQSIELVGGESMEDAAEKKADEGHNEALNPGFGELEKSWRYEAGDEGGYAQIAEERCSEFEPFVVHQVGHSQTSFSWRRLRRAARSSLPFRRRRHSL